MSIQILQHKRPSLMSNSQTPLRPSFSTVHSKNMKRNNVAVKISYLLGILFIMRSCPFFIYIKMFSTSWNNGLDRKQKILGFCFGLFLNSLTCQITREPSSFYTKYLFVFYLLMLSTDLKDSSKFLLLWNAHSEQKRRQLLLQQILPP